MKAKILFALTALLMLGSVSLNAQENGNSSNSESTTQLEGDLNHDNKVDVADVTYLVNIIMNQSTSENIPVSGVSISTSESSINVGNTLQLEATVSPSNATNKNVTWSSSNTSIATVNQTTGLVTGIAIGTTTITATSIDNPNKKATINVEVVAALSGYYWYIGAENSSSISNVQTDNTIAGWHNIGSSLSGFNLSTTSNPVVLSTTSTKYTYYIIIPNELGIYDDDGANGLYMFNEVTCNIAGYKAYIWNDTDFGKLRKVQGITIK